MKKTKLGNVCLTMQTGKTPPTSVVAYFGGDIPWYTPGDIGKTSILTTSSRTVSQKAVDDKKAVLFDEGSLLITCIGDIGRCGIMNFKASFNQQITAINFSRDVDVRYAYFWFVA